jgi:hypothetical protein
MTMQDAYQKAHRIAATTQRPAFVVETDDPKAQASTFDAVPEEDYRRESRAAHYFDHIDPEE